MEDVADELALLELRVVVVVVRSDHLAQVVGVALNDHFSVFSCQSETVQRGSNFRGIQLLSNYNLQNN